MREHEERDKEILAHWNAGKTYTEIAILMCLKSRNTVSGAISRARDRGEYVREDKPRAHKRRTQRIPPLRTNLRSRRKNTPRRNEELPLSVIQMNGTSELNAKLRQGRCDRNIEWWDKRLPENDEKCRWPSGEILDGTIAFCCKDKRENLHMPLVFPGRDRPGCDPLPYCLYHSNIATGKILESSLYVKENEPVRESELA